MTDATESPIILKSATRAILPLGKYRVVEHSDTHIKIRLNEGASFVVNLKTDAFDIRLGDLLTLYTEVLFNAKPN